MSGRKGMKQYPSAIKEKVRKQIAAGRSQKEISREYGISKYTPMWHFIPNFHSLPFFVWCISESRAFSAFLVELGALMMVASTMVPPFIMCPVCTMTRLIASKNSLFRPFASKR